MVRKSLTCGGCRRTGDPRQWAAGLSLRVTHLHSSTELVQVSDTPRPAVLICAVHRAGSAAVNLRYRLGFPGYSGISGAVVGGRGLSRSGCGGKRSRTAERSRLHSERGHGWPTERPGATAPARQQFADMNQRTGESRMPQKRRTERACAQRRDASGTQKKSAAASGIVLNHPT